MSKEMTITFSDEVYSRMQELAGKNGVSEGEIIRRALALLSVCDENRPVGGHVVITDSNMNQLVKITGIDGPAP